MTRMRLTERDLHVLKMLEKLRVMDIELVRKFSNFCDYQYAAKRLKTLYNNGYVKYDQDSVSSKRYYYISQKGMDLLFPPIEKTSKRGIDYISRRPAPKYKNLAHEITIGYVLYEILQSNPGLTEDDFQTEREIIAKIPLKHRKKTIKHTCDLLCEEHKVKIEVELTKKNKSRIENNILFNGHDYAQVWITGSNQVHNLLLKLQPHEIFYYLYIVKLDQLQTNPIYFSEIKKGMKLKRKEIDEHNKRVYELRKAREQRR